MVLLYQSIIWNDWFLLMLYVEWLTREYFILVYHNPRASPDGWAVWCIVLFTRWWLLVDHCVLRNWDWILVRAVKGLISWAGMVSICPLLWQRDVKLQQTKTTTLDWRGGGISTSDVLLKVGYGLPTVWYIQTPGCNIDSQLCI